MSCVYDADSPPKRQRFISAAPATPSASLQQEVPTSPIIRHTSPAPSQRTSAEPEVSIDNGVAVGPSSGVSFLYKWHRGFDNVQEAPNSSPLATYGDVPLPKVPKANLPSLEEGYLLVNHYFRFAMPTFRFFHQQTLERWMVGLVQRKTLPAAEAASVLIVWAQALGFAGPDSESDSHASERGLSYYEHARTLLAAEVGPMSLASIEARLASCLYLLSVSHINECRFLFSFTHTLAIAMGLHRQQPRRHQVTPLEAERRKRLFWSLYLIDGYLSVVLGQPRHLRDEDLDQDYPLNIDDLVLDSAADLTLVPHHGNVEAFIYHARLARLFAQSNDLLYPIQHLSKEEIVQRGTAMTSSLDKLEGELPAFLQPRPSASLGTQTWERQNSVLGLALAHARIIATRRTLLVGDFYDLVDQHVRHQHQACMNVCLDAICGVLQRVHPMLQHNRLLRGFWMTQYIALCAISTLYVYKIQCDRRRVTLPINNTNLPRLLSQADEVREHLAKIAPPGSQARRHHELLSRLRQGAQHDTPPMTGLHTESSLRNVGTPAYESQPRSDYVSQQIPLGSAEAISTGDFTPVNLFNTAISDAASWQYLDQLLLQPQFDSIWPYS